MAAVVLATMSLMVKRSSAWRDEASVMLNQQQ